jgi:hypothetical protein
MAEQNIRPRLVKVDIAEDGTLNIPDGWRRQGVFEWATGGGVWVWVVTRVHQLGER